MAYKNLVSLYIRALQDRGLTQREIARTLGLQNANVVNMHLHQKTSPFPIKRLPALVKACGLDGYQAIQLVTARTRDFPDNPTELDKDTLFWILRCANQARAIVKARRSS